MINISRISADIRVVSTNARANRVFARSFSPGCMDYAMTIECQDVALVYVAVSKYKCYSHNSRLSCQYIYCLLITLYIGLNKNYVIIGRKYALIRLKCMCINFITRLQTTCLGSV